MEVYESVAPLKTRMRSLRSQSATIGLVPTMGNLHAGHLALVDAALENCDFVVSSVFVNPLQFGPNEDLQSYPHTPEEDKARLSAQGCHAMFLPSVEEMYGPAMAQHTIIHVPGLSEGYCGQSRPGHFDGVATVVCKLLNLVQPDMGFFGLKDYQQFLVIRKMVADLALPVTIRGVETVRDDKGLALSSRNNYLDNEQKSRATMIYQCLCQCADCIREGARDYVRLEQAAIATLEAAGLRLDYFAVCNAHTLKPASDEDVDLVILAAAYVGKSRLIDNLRLNLGTG